MGDRTFSALWRSRQANRGAQFHHGLIPIAGRFSGEQFLRRDFQLPPNRGSAKLATHGTQPRQNTRHISVEHRQRLFIRDAKDRGSRVASDAWQGECSFVLTRKTAGVARIDFLSRAKHIFRAAVIAKSCPVAENCFSTSARQRLHIRKPQEKTFVVGHDHGDARLLQHDFRKPDTVGIFRSSPGEVALAHGKPGQQFAPEFSDFARGVGST